MSDTVDYGPLTGLIGTWEGSKGMDVAPEPDGTEKNPFYETITIEAIGDATNAEEQTLAVLRYHQVVSRKSNDQVFHDQVGYWMYDAATGQVMHSLTIPRAVCVLAGGSAETDGDKTVIKVEAPEGGTDFGVVQSPFMKEKARTVSFTYEGTVEGDSFNYFETTVLDIYGRIFEHTDKSFLTRVK